RYLCLYSPAASRIYSPSLHDALPICGVLAHRRAARALLRRAGPDELVPLAGGLSIHPTVELPTQSTRLRRMSVLPDPATPFGERDRKSTRLNSSHGSISYAVFCLKKK